MKFYGMVVICQTKNDHASSFMMARASLQPYDKYSTVLKLIR